MLCIFAPCKGQTWKSVEGFLSEWKQRAVPCVWSSACVYCGCAREGPWLCCLPPEQQCSSKGSQWPLWGAGAPSPRASSTWQLHSNIPCSGCRCTDLRQLQIISQLGLPKHGKQEWASSSHAARALHFGVVLFNSFSYSNSLSTWLCISSLCREGDQNPVSRILQSTPKVQPAAVLLHAKHDCVVRTCALRAHLKSCSS